MKDRCISVTLDRAINQVDAIDTLGASLAAGLHAGTIAHDHVQTLMNIVATHIRQQLEELRSAIDNLPL